MKSTFLSALLDELQTKGGFSANMTEQKVIRHGYAVSVTKDSEEKFEGVLKPIAPFAEHDTIAHAITHYVFDHLEELADRDTVNVLGAWLDDSGTLWLDVSMIVNTAEEAGRLARENNQVAYYDFQKSEVVYV